MTNYSKQQPESIQRMFGSIAKKYDRANAILSLNMHKSWGNRLVKSMPAPSKQQVLLDLCCGTGDIAFSYLSQAQTPQKVILVDFCQEMLECAKDKATNLSRSGHSLEFIQADVQALPLHDSSISCATLAYGIRNVQDPFKCFKEVYRVMKPGGTLGILELTQPKNGFIQIGHTFYLKVVLPLLGRWITSNREAYEYLCNSIPRFVTPDKLGEMMLQAGFSSVQQTPLAFGTTTLFLAKKD